MLVARVNYWFEKERNFQDYYEYLTLVHYLPNLMMIPHQFFNLKMSLHSHLQKVLNSLHHPYLVKSYLHSYFQYHDLHSDQNGCLNFEKYFDYMFIIEHFAILEHFSFQILLFKFMNSNSNCHWNFKHLSKILFYDFA